MIYWDFSYSAYFVHHNTLWFRNCHFHFKNVWAEEIGPRIQGKWEVNQESDQIMSKSVSREGRANSMLISSLDHTIMETYYVAESSLSWGVQNTMEGGGRVLDIMNPLPWFTQPQLSKVPLGADLAVFWVHNIFVISVKWWKCLPMIFGIWWKNLKNRALSDSHILDSCTNTGTHSMSHVQGSNTKFAK